jgi:hypothetical protein
MKKILNTKFFLLVSISLLALGNAAFAETCYPEGCVNYDYYSVPKQNTLAEHIAKVVYNLGVSHSGENHVVYTKDSLGKITNITCSNTVPVLAVTYKCANGAGDYPTCLACASGYVMTSAGICVVPPCTNGAYNPPICDACPVGQSLVNGICGIPCSISNACGQSVQGRQENGICNTDNGSTNQYGYENINSSCIQTFNVTSSSIYPNGSTEFNWSFPQLPAGIGRRCGFVDLSNPNTPTPVAGLQNLDASVDKVRIQNIQRTTNFCLVCSFYDTATNRSRGEAAAHNWVRVIRVGEN